MYTLKISVARRTAIASKLAPTGNVFSPEVVHDQTSAARPLDAPVGSKAAAVLMLILIWAPR
ncbi:hypothetical protein PS662_00452 [Pseudomonas fluorescens]|uniref:Uncharacterized protein n=1 Tax=Pseudomonas fluorescens TaxID=294 RepID=A0A5E6PKP2_PSEFL|nr:hypothetical protein PS662_00452 [Pseudomonas fluorescens]